MIGHLDVMVRVEGDAGGPLNFCYRLPAPELAEMRRPRAIQDPSDLDHAQRAEARRRRWVDAVAAQIAHGLAEGLIAGLDGPRS